jgi:hypothetical protein
MYLDLFMLHPKPYNIHDLQPSPITFKCHSCNLAFDNKFPLETVQKITDSLVQQPSVPVSDANSMVNRNSSVQVTVWLSDSSF